MARVLLVEDDAAVSIAIQAVLSGLGHTVEAAPTAELGLEAARARPAQLVLLDLHLPGLGGLDVLPELVALDPARPVVVITALPTAENAIDAMARGAAAHLVKPLEPEELSELVARLLSAPALPEDPPEGAGPASLVGTSRPMLELGRRIGLLARSDATVLIRGESGTGKELVARAIHARSARAARPFVAVSCAALPDTLFEAELFGHEKGAFTGAAQARAGRVERAEGGTLFLDEVGELTLAAQAKLLRFLEERTYERIGGDRSRRADVRVLTATNAPLEERVASDAFRADLYYRLNVAQVTLPALRERREDIPLLSEHLLARLGRPGIHVQPAALAELLARPWGGNVRQLRNTLESAVVALGGGSELRLEHLPPPGAPAPGAPEPGRLEDAARALVRDAVASGAVETDLHTETRRRLEHALLGAALELTGGNQVASARLLGMNRATFRRKMGELGLGPAGTDEGED